MSSMGFVLLFLTSSIEQTSYTARRKSRSVDVPRNWESCVKVSKPFYNKMPKWSVFPLYTRSMISKVLHTRHCISSKIVVYFSIASDAESSGFESWPRSSDRPIFTARRSSRDVNVIGFSEMTLKTDALRRSKCGTLKNLHCSMTASVEECSPSQMMVTSPCEWKFLGRDK